MSLESCGLLHESLKKIVSRLSSAVRGSSEDIRAKYAIQNLETHLKSVVDDMHPEKVRELTDIAIDNLTQNKAKSLLHTMNSHRNFLDAVQRLDQLMDGFSSINGFKNAINEFFQYSTLAAQRATMNLNRGLEDLFDLAHLRGFNAKEAAQVKRWYQNHVGGGTDLKKALEKADDISLKGDDAELAILEALRVGSYKRGGKSSRILNILGSTYKKWDDLLVNMIGETNTPFKGKKGYVVPIEENGTIIYDMGRAKYKEVALKHMDLKNMFPEEIQALRPDKFDKYVDDWINDRYDRIIGDPAGGAPVRQNSKIDSGRIVEFATTKDEFDYFRATRSKSDDILSVAHYHKMKLLRNAATYEIFGQDPKAMLGALENHIKSRPNVKEAYKGQNVDAIGEHLMTKAKDTGVISSGYKSFDNLTTVLAEAGSRFMSAGLVWRGLIRDLAYDRSIHAAAMKAVFTGKSIHTEWFKTINGLFKNWRNRGESAHIERMFNDIGISTKLSMVSMIRGEEATYEAATTTVRDGFVQAADTLANLMSMLSLSDKLARASRVFEASNSARLIFNILDSDYKTLSKNDLFYFNRAGIDETDFNDLRRAKRTQHEGKDILIKPEDITSSKRGLSVEEESARILSNKYLHLLETITGEISTVTTVHGNPGKLPGEFGPLGQMIFKFYGMPLSQYRALLNNTRAAAGMDPTAGWKGDVTGLFGTLKTRQGMLLLGKRMTTGMMGGFMIEWMSDLANGREPRDISPEMFFRAFQQTGIGGVGNMVATDFVYGDDIAGTPISAYVGPIKDLALSPTRAEPGAAAGKALHRLSGATPGFNLWYVRGLMNFLFSTALEEHNGRQQKEAEERGNQYFWD